jgi:hypothetical protein
MSILPVTGRRCLMLKAGADLMTGKLLGPMVGVIEYWAGPGLVSAFLMSIIHLRLKTLYLP